MTEPDAIHPIDTSGRKLGIVYCPACDGPHEDIDVHPYVTSNPPYTHWIICPETGDPVPFALIADGDRELQPNNAVIRDFVKAQRSEIGWMACFFYAHGPEEVTLMRTAQTFPHARFGACIDALTKNLNNEMGTLTPGEMLIADPDIKPLVDIWSGDNGQGEDQEQAPLADGEVKEPQASEG